MTRHIRVRETNLETAISLLIEAGFTAEPTKNIPCSNRFHYRSWPGTDYEADRQLELEDTAGMAGVETSASGTQAHRVFVAGGMFNNRTCNCGSGQNWTTCSAASQYCG